MTAHERDSIDVLRFDAWQHATYVTIAFAIWLTGVVVVRLLPDTAFDTSEPWSILLFVASIGLGVGTQLIVPTLVRLPLSETLVPVMALCGAALLMDGLAISFTDIYSDDIATKVVVGGWLLWTFGAQIIISIFIVGRSGNA